MVAVVVGAIFGMISGVILLFCAFAYQRRARRKEQNILLKVEDRCLKAQKISTHLPSDRSKQLSHIDVLCDNNVDINCSSNNNANNMCTISNNINNIPRVGASYDTCSNFASLYLMNDKAKEVDHFTNKSLPNKKQTNNCKFLFDFRHKKSSESSGEQTCHNSCPLYNPAIKPPQVHVSSQPFIIREPVLYHMTSIPKPPPPPILKDITVNKSSLLPDIYMHASTKHKNIFCKKSLTSKIFSEKQKGLENSNCTKLLETNDHLKSLCREDELQMDGTCTYQASTSCPICQLDKYKSVERRSPANNSSSCVVDCCIATHQQKQQEVFFTTQSAETHLNETNFQKFDMSQKVMLSTFQGHPLALSRQHLPGTPPTTDFHKDELSKRLNKTLRLQTSKNGVVDRADIRNLQIQLKTIER
ncbi:hypothetical protein HELRODRAFT_171349 [Helobdella robusta]|uniref:Uncharacterized protein n=1 Tax=Helobdella robusta TaxID=6412 RepID=T1F460_HELRO|nr:hypothetical protein HELRODRAFT_171349 [Helobdella robusta]ESO05689.1 hypothetical protein HELRODRAFT_171349 [Helobdella robusta]